MLVFLVRLNFGCVIRVKNVSPKLIAAFLFLENSDVNLCW